MPTPEPQAPLPGGLGRVYIPDARDARFPLGALVKPPSKLSALASKSWTTGGILDQGMTSECVRYAVTQLLQTRNVVRSRALELTSQLYPWAQRNDEWPGEAYDGTSVRAGLQYGRTQASWFESFHWALSMDEALSWLSRNGPLVLGTEWFTGMDAPTAKGLIDPSGPSRGGHCFLATGVNMRDKLITITNSWGARWGLKGKAKLTFDAFEYLIFGANGEAAAVIELSARKKAA